VRVAVPLVRDGEDDVKRADGPYVVMRAGRRVPRYDGVPHGGEFLAWAVYGVGATCSIVSLEDVIDSSGDATRLCWHHVWPAVAHVPASRVLDAACVYLRSEGAVPDAYTHREEDDDEQ
jgi:hypothetical protein